MITIIAAKSFNNVIGNNNTIPWYCKEDFKHFRETTKDSVVIMGRNTFESIGRPLPNRISIIVTKTKFPILKEKYPFIDDLNNEIYIAKSIESAIEIAKSFEKEIFIIGGSNIY